jgi:hypothetical protein
MPSHCCCSLCMRESTSSGGITLHCQSCGKYKTHMATVFQLKNRSVSRARANVMSTRGLTQTPYSQQQEPECSMEIDDLVSLLISTCSAESSEYCLNSHIHLVLSLRQCLYLLHCHLLHVLHQPCLRVHHHCLHPHPLLITYPRSRCHHHLQPYHN